MKPGPLLSLSNVVDLASANLFSLVMNVITIPLIALLYSPEDYGLYALLLASATLGGIIVTLKLEAEVVKAKSFEQMAHIIAIIIVNALVCTGFLLVFVPSLEIWIGIDKSLIYAGLAMTLSRVLWDTSYSYLLWKGIVSKLRLAKIFYSLGLTLGFAAFSNLGFYGLLFSCILAAVTVLLVIPIRNLKVFISTIQSLEKLSIIYRRLISKSSLLAFSTLFSIVSMEMPVFVFSSFYTMQEAGIFSISYKIAAVPVSLVAAATSDLFFGWSKDKSKSQIAGIARPLPVKLLMYSPVFVGAYFLVVFIMLSFLQRDDWEDVPTTFLMLYSWILLTLATNPIENSFAIMDRQRDSLVIQAIILVIRVLSVFIAISFDLSAISFLILFVTASTLGRLILLIGIQRIFQDGEKFLWQLQLPLLLAGCLSILSIVYLIISGSIKVACALILTAFVIQFSSKVFRADVFFLMGNRGK